VANSTAADRVDGREGMHEAGGRVSLASLPDPELIARYRQGLSGFDPRLFELSDEQMDQAFLPEASADAGVNLGRWPVRVLVGHLADAELAYTHRMRRAVAEDQPLLGVWDENAFIDAGLYADGRQPVAAFVAVIHTLRRWTAEWLLTLAPGQMDRQALHPERGPESVRDMLVIATWHFEHHGRYLNAKIGRLLGPAPEHPPRQEGKAGGGCCGGGGGCGGGGCGCGGGACACSGKNA
jgi:hypothetical protein